MPTVRHGAFDDMLFDQTCEAAAGAEQMKQLNHEQRQVADQVLYAVSHPGGCRAFFVDGPGGTGKTFLYSTLLHVVRGMGLIAIPVAWTGIAATLLKDGRTAHSRFKLPVPLFENSTSGLTPNRHKHEAAILRESSLILWDEAPMAPSHALTIVDRLLRELTAIDLPFGGKTIVFGGDFRQVLPVVPHASRATLVSTSIKRNDLWPSITRLRLTTNMRAGHHQQEFAAWLKQLGDGTLPVVAELGDDVVRLPDESVTQENLIDVIFGHSLTAENAHRQASRAILCPKNDDCFSINNEVIERLPGEMKTYYSVDSVICDDLSETSNYPPEFLNSLTPACRHASASSDAEAGRYSDAATQSERQTRIMQRNTMCCTAADDQLS